VKKIEKKMDDALALRLENKRAKKTNNEKEEFSPSLQVVFSIVDRSQFEI
jgi:hypothetical protein